MSLEITQKQRRNAARELTSIVCAGCDGSKNRGSAFCKKCYNLAMENTRFGLIGPVDFAEDYTEILIFLLSRKGQKLRLALT